jgi:hypothetical protein
MRATFGLLHRVELCHLFRFHPFDQASDVEVICASNNPRKRHGVKG